MRFEICHTMFDERLNCLRHQPSPMPLTAQDIANLQAVIADLAVMVVDHTDALATVFVGDSPGNGVVWRRCLGEKAQTAACFFNGFTGGETPISGQLLVPEAGMQTRLIPRVELAQGQTRCDQRRARAG
ncbi:hypothetical protein HB779_11945 [Phyllobacterium sp. 628]|nr:hypothetical protein [Phyllobacterium sp. 628]QND50699.1 hypothetical protein HB779_11945 [Phyllobacterium sp. 628]